MSSDINFFDPNRYIAKKARVPSYNIDHSILVFDCVNFSSIMNNNNMLRIIADIQQAVADVLDNELGYYWGDKNEDAPKTDLLLIPTGDGYIIALNNLRKDKEILEIAQSLYNRFRSDKLNIRMGIAKGKNVVTLDLNDDPNIFGYGVVLATRVCSVAEPGQILIHDNLAKSFLQEKDFEDLQLISKPFKVKHNLKLTCYNYYKKGHFGVSI